MLVNCATSARDLAHPGKYRYGWLHVYVPKALVEGGFPHRTYRMYFVPPGEAPAGAARCVIPNSPALVRYLNNWFARGQPVDSVGRMTPKGPQRTDDPPGPVTIGGMITYGYPSSGGYVSGGGGGYDCGNYPCGDSSHGDNNGGGGGDYEPPPSCDPKVDSTCEVPLDSADLNAMDTSLTLHVRVPSTIADTANRRLCQQLTDQLASLFRSGQVFRGRYSTTIQDTIPDGPDHYGMTYAGRIHTDPDIIDAAIRGDTAYQYILARNQLHEAAHSLNYKHPNKWDANGNYLDSPFNLLDTRPDHCLQ